MAQEAKQKAAEAAADRKTYPVRKALTPAIREHQQATQIGRTETEKSATIDLPVHGVVPPPFSDAMNAPQISAIAATNNALIPLLPTLPSAILPAVVSTSNVVVKQRLPWGSGTGSIRLAHFDCHALTEPSLTNSGLPALTSPSGVLIEENKALLLPPATFIVPNATTAVPFTSVDSQPSSTLTPSEMSSPSNILSNSRNIKAELSVLPEVDFSATNPIFDLKKKLEVLGADLVLQLQVSVLQLRDLVFNLEESQLYAEKLVAEQGIAVDSSVEKTAAEARKELALYKQYLDRCAIGLNTILGPDPAIIPFAVMGAGQPDTLTTSTESSQVLENLAAMPAELQSGLAVCKEHLNRYYAKIDKILGLDSTVQSVVIGTKQSQVSITSRPAVATSLTNEGKSSSHSKPSVTVPSSNVEDHASSVSTTSPVSATTIVVTNNNRLSLPLVTPNSVLGAANNAAIFAQGFFGTMPSSSDSKGKSSTQDLFTGASPPAQSPRGLSFLRQKFTLAEAKELSIQILNRDDAEKHIKEGEKLLLKNKDYKAAILHLEAAHTYLENPAVASDVSLLQRTKLRLGQALFENAKQFNSPDGFVKAKNYSMEVIWLWHRMCSDGQKSHTCLDRATKAEKLSMACDEVIKLCLESPQAKV